MVLKATHEGLLKLADTYFKCYVLEDGRRVLNQRTLASAFSITSKGGNVFLRSMKSKSIGSELDENLKNKLYNPLKIKGKRGDLALCIEAEYLPDICTSILNAKYKNKLSLNQMNIAKQAEILIRSLAKIGITALVDEATGYQYSRHPEELRLLVEKYIEKDKLEWQKEFKDEYYIQLNRVYSNNLILNNYKKRPQYFANFTLKYIYKPMENGEVLKELDKINPIRDCGTRKDKLHQHLTNEYGKIKLREQIQEVTTLLKISNSINEFKKNFNKLFPQKFYQYEFEI